MATEASKHDILNGTDAAAVLARLPAMGRVMVIGRATGVTHERIGPVESVAETGGALRIGGACHDAQVDPARVASVRIDRRSVMRDKVYPRLDFHAADGALLFAVVGMDGVESFDAALADLARVPAEPPVGSDETKPDLADDDPLHAPFAELVASGAEVAIRIRRPGLEQCWRGKVEAVKPAMGFLNVMTPDFHLHLAGGALASWAREPGARIAIGHDGQPTGLSLLSAAFA